jgi:hypothetical protein
MFYLPISVKCVTIFSILDTILKFFGKKLSLATFHSLDADPDPDPAK